MRKIVAVLVWLFLVLIHPSGAAESDAAFFKMIEEGDLKGIQNAIASGFDINRNYGDRNPLEYAVLRQKPRVVRLLLDLNAEVNIQNSSGWTPLVTAVAIDVRKSTASHSGPKIDKENSAEIVSLILANGADVNIRGDLDFTALIAALVGSDLDRSVEMARKLVEKGAEVNPRITSGQYPIYYALAPAALMEDLPFSRQDDHRLKLLTILLNARADTNVRLGHSLTPLHVAVAVGSEQAIALLMKYGADPTITDSEGRTPAEKAREAERSDLQRMMIQ